MTAAIVQSNARRAGKNTMPNWIVLTEVNCSLSCLWVWSGLIWSALLRCVKNFTARTERSFKQCRATSRVHQAEVMTDTRSIAIMILLTEIF